MNAGIAIIQIAILILSFFRPQRRHVASCKKDVKRGSSEGTEGLLRRAKFHVKIFGFLTKSTENHEFCKLIRTVEANTLFDVYEIYRFYAQTGPIHKILPEPDYVTFGSLLSQIRPSVCLSVCRLPVTLVHPTQGLNLLAIFFHLFVRCPVPILRPPCKILRRSSQGNPSVGGVEREKFSKIQRLWTYRRLYLINDTKINA